MNEQIFNKLVCDKIPEIIENLDDAAYRKKLEEKIIRRMS